MTAPAPDPADLERLLAELERLDAEATPGPWRVDPDDREDMDWNNHVLSADGGRICFMAHGGPARQTEFDANAALIAAARTALPALIEDRRQTRALAERLASALEAASVAMPFLHDAQAMHGRSPGEPDAEGVAIKIGAALADARSAGLIETAKEGSDVG